MAFHPLSVKEASYKIGLLLLAGITQAQAQLPSRIAALQTDAQVLELIRPLGWEYAEAILGDSVVQAYQPFAKTRFAVSGCKTWFKVDFDQNGRPDLLILARRKDIPLVFCVLDLGDGNFQVVRNFYSAVLRRSPVARVVRRRGKDLLEYADFARSRGSRGQLRGRQTQLLRYVAGGFVNYKPHHKEHQLHRIDLEAHSAYHQIVNTRIKVEGDSVWAWQKRQNVLDSTKVTQTVYLGRLLPKQQIELSVMLGYIRLTKSRQQYGRERLNHHTRINLLIDYDVQKQVRIKDLNGNGTLALRRLYSLLWQVANLN